MIINTKNVEKIERIILTTQERLAKSSQLASEKASAAIARCNLITQEIASMGSTNSQFMHSQTHPLSVLLSRRSELKNFRPELLNELAQLQNAIKLTNLFSMASRGDFINIVLHIAQGVDVNIADENGLTMLHVAAYYNQTNVIAGLLAIPGINANPVITSSGIENGMTPLHISIIQNNIIPTTMLLQRAQSAGDVDLNAKFGDGASALHAAAYSDNVVAMISLLNAGMNVNDKTDTGITPWHVAAFFGRYRIFELTKTSGNMNLDGIVIPIPQSLANIDLNAHDIDGATPLFYAITGWSARNSIKDKFIEKLLESSTFEEYKQDIAAGRKTLNQFANHIFNLCIKSLMTDPRVDVNYRINDIDALTMMVKSKSSLESIDENIKGGMEELIVKFIATRPELTSSISTLKAILGMQIASADSDMVVKSVVEKLKAQNAIITEDSTISPPGTHQKTEEHIMRSHEEVVASIINKMNLLFMNSTINASNENGTEITIDIHKITEEELIANAKKILEEGILEKEFPNILRFGMELKEKNHQEADGIIKQSIIKMASASKDLHEEYKMAIHNILHEEFPNARALLGVAVKEIDEDMCYKWNRNLLHQASFDLRSEIVELLCKGGADLDRLDDNGWCSLTIVICKKGQINSANQQEVGQILLNYGASIHAGGSIYDQPIACVSTRLDLWSEMFINHAHHSLYNQIPITNETKSQIATVPKVAYPSLEAFYREMGYNTEGLGEFLVDEF